MKTFDLFMSFLYCSSQTGSGSGPGAHVFGPGEETGVSPPKRSRAPRVQDGRRIRDTGTGRMRECNVNLNVSACLRQCLLSDRNLRKRPGFASSASAVLAYSYVSGEICSYTFLCILLLVFVLRETSDESIQKS